MKLSLKLFLIIGTLFIINSCADDDTGLRNLQEGKSGVLGFEKSNNKFPNLEGQPNELLIKVDMSAAADHDRVFTVNVNAEETDATSDMYSIDQSTLMIPANENYGFIKMTGNIDNLPVGELYTIVLDLVSIEGDFVLNTEKQQQVIDIFRACPLGDGFPLDYIIEVQAFNAAAPTHEQTLTLVDPLFNIYHMDSSWGPNFVAWATGNNGYAGQYIYPGTLTVNCDNTVSFDGDDSWGTGGTGTYDPVSGNMYLTLTQGLFTTNFTVNIIMYPN